MHDICHWSVNHIQIFTPGVRWNLQYRKERKLSTVKLVLKHIHLHRDKFMDTQCTVIVDHNASDPMNKFDVVCTVHHPTICMHRASSYNMYVPCIILQYVYEPIRCTKILVIRLYFLLYAVHVSDYISPSSEAILYAVHRIWCMVCASHWFIYIYTDE